MGLTRWMVGSYAIVLLALATAGLGCGSEEKPPAPPSTAPEATPPAAPGAPEPVAEAPEWAGELPVDFPADVPRYPGAKVASARGNEEVGVAVTFDSADGLAAVAKFYSDSLAAQGWQTQTQELPEGTMIMAEKEDRRASALVRSGGQATLIQLIVVKLK
jgi:hypothetical protein